MRSIECNRHVLMYAAFLVACNAIIALAQARFVPARYRDGPLPQIPLQAIGGGEVLLELTVSSAGGAGTAKTVRTTPPFTDILVQAVRQWRFLPAEEAVEPASGRPGEPVLRRAIDAKVLVAGLFRPPTLNAPTSGAPPKDLASASDEIPFPQTIVMPPYPPLARDSGIVLVEVQVDRRGDVVGVKAIRPAPPFDTAALDAARRWKFRPARLHGSSVDTFAYIVFGFRQPVTVVPKRSSGFDPFAFFRPAIALNGDDHRDLEGQHMP